MTLEVAASDVAINGDAWIDPEVVELAGISPEELEAMRNPPAGPGAPVAQPSFDENKYHMGYPEEIYKLMLSAPDEVLIERMSYAEPPVKVLS